MKKNIKIWFLALLALAFVLTPISLINATGGGGGGGAGGGNSASCTGDQIDTVFGCIGKGDKALSILVGKTFAWVSGIIGTLSMLGLIYAGFTYITSAGNPDSIMKAKNIIWTSLAALFIIIFAWALFSLLGLGTL